MSKWGHFEAYFMISTSYDTDISRVAPLVFPFLKKIFLLYWFCHTLTWIHHSFMFLIYFYQVLMSYALILLSVFVNYLFYLILPLFGVYILLFLTYKWFFKDWKYDDFVCDMYVFQNVFSLFTFSMSFFGLPWWLSWLLYSFVCNQIYKNHWIQSLVSLLERYFLWY